MIKHDGYVTDTAYPAHFHRELQPLWLATQALAQGAAPPDLSGPYAYCELGCGVGVNLLVNAATQPHAQFVGVDVNARHLAVARRAAQQLGLTNLRFIHADFSSFARSNSLFFDLIVSHGVWSWISAAQQRDVLALVGRFLKPAGLFYLHYQCHPGATRMLPAQKLLNELAHHLTGSATQNVQAGLALLDRLDGAGIFHDQPDVGARLQALQRQDAAYLAHDLLNDHWSPQHSADLHRQVSRAGLTYLASADPFENLESLSVPGAIQPVLAGIRIPSVRELVKDLARHQHQRRDLFQKQPVALSAEAHLAALGALRLARLPQAPGSGAVEFRTPIGAINGPSELFSPLLERLAQGPARVDALSQLPVYSGKPALLMQSLQMLMWQGYAHPLRQDAHDSAATAQALQRWLDRQDLRIDVVNACATAVHRPLSFSHD
jgi:SAM-dependent methyltransferase